VSDRPIRLGTALVTMVEPHRGHEVDYNRWYERDHFYAGCLIGPYCFAGRRFVATRELKALRYPTASPITPARDVGSFLAIYWILDGHHEEWNRWAVDQVNLLHQRGRMFAHRDHIHTLLYQFQWAARRDQNGVPAELALDHPYRGLVTVFGRRTAGADELRSSVEQRLGGTDLCLHFTALPLLADAPGDVPRADTDPSRFVQLWFLENDPRDSWTEGFERLADHLQPTAEVDWVAPFIPTVPGTDAYTDQLW
jgi:hypothetical protein